MGFFTKNSMNLDEMAKLVRYTVMMILGYHHKTGNWADNDARMKFVNSGLERSGHKASFWKLAKLAIAADGIARMVTANVPDLMDMVTSDPDERDEFTAELLTLCRSALLEQGITS